MGGNAPPGAPPVRGGGAPPGKFFVAYDTLLVMGFQNIYSFIMIHLHRPSLLRPKDFT